MKNTNTTLMNFRAPNEIKEEFNYICRMTSTTMTSEIVRFMMRFITEGNKKIKQHNIESQLISPNIERQGNLIKDPLTSTWVSIENWNDRNE